jgi:hypothetical protein
MEKFNLPDNVVFKIYEDNKGRIWFFSHTGKLAYFYKEAIYPYKYNDRISQNFNTIVITNGYVTDDDEIVINDTRRNIRISRDGVISSSPFMTQHIKDSTCFQITAIAGSPNRYFAQITQGNEYALGWVVVTLNINGINRIFRVPGFQTFPQQFSCVSGDGKSFFLYFERNLIKLNLDGTSKRVLLPANINCLEIDNDNLWAGLVKSGAVLLDMQLNILSREPALPEKSVTSIRKDYEGGIWFSTLEKGVFYLKNSQVKHLTGDTSLNRNTFSVFTENDGSLLFGNKDGVFRLSGQHVDPVLQRKHVRIYEILTDNQRNLFVMGSLEIRNCLFGELAHISDKYFDKAFLLYSNAEGIAMGGNKFLLSSYYGTVY